MAVVEVIVIPLVLFALGVLWPQIARYWRNRSFEALVLRELAEARPHGPPGSAWHRRLSRRFVHRDLIERPVDSRDLVLGLHPTVAYHLTQLWGAHRSGDAEDWRYHLCELHLFFQGEPGLTPAEDPGSHFHRLLARRRGRQAMLDRLLDVRLSWQRVIGEPADPGDPCAVSPRDPTAGSASPSGRGAPTG